MQKIIILCSFFFIAYACNDAYIPHPKGYPKITFPTETDYQTFNIRSYPYTFSYPTYAHYEKDSALIDPNNKDSDFWINIVFPSLNGTIYLTYKSLAHTSLDQLIYEAFKLTNKQVYKATSIKNKTEKTPQGYDVVYFSVSGDAATAYQFFVTDNKYHFLRGSLYLNSTPNEDSLKIVNDFLQKDITHLINTLTFKN